MTTENNLVEKEFDNWFESGISQNMAWWFDLFPGNQDSNSVTKAAANTIRLRY
ncbi:MAG: hypothetical protein GY757_31565 [bacterium]|nr:hypothetical protein [bacterium]